MIACTLYRRLPILALYSPWWIRSFATSVGLRVFPWAAAPTRSMFSPRLAVFLKSGLSSIRLSGTSWAPDTSELAGQWFRV